PRGTPCALSHSIPGRIAAAMMTARKSRAITSLSFHRASATTTIPPTTSVASAARFAVSFMTRDFSPDRESCKPMVGAREQVYMDERRHGIVLVGSFLRAFALAAAGTFLVVVGWPATVAGSFLLLFAAFVALRAVWRWER